MRLRLKPSMSVSSTQDDGRIAAAQTHPADDAPHGPWFGAQCRQRLDSRDGHSLELSFGQEVGLAVRSARKG
jgi:hypothetical protein